VGVVEAASEVDMVTNIYDYSVTMCRYQTSTSAR